MVTEYERAKSRKSYLKNREAVLRRTKERYLANREKILAQNKAWRKANPEKRLQSSRKHRALNGDKCRKKCRDWYQRNLERERKRVRERNRKNYQRDRLKILEANRKWRQENKHCVHARDMKRKALLKGATVNLRKIKEWIASVKSKPTAVCYYCSTEIPSSFVHFDHIIALARGGPHSIENLCVSCAGCNLSKKAQPIEAWVRIGQQIFSV